MDSNLLKERFARARGRSSAFWDAYRRACEYAAPSINSFTGAEGSTKSPDVSTSQALRSTNAFISFFIGALTPPNRRWAQLRPTINMVREFATRGGFTSIAQAEGVLFGAYDEITSVFFEALDMSNFYAVEDQFVRSIGIGTGCLLINEIPVGRQHRNSVPFEFINVPIANLSLDTGNNGRIYGVFREMHVRRAEVPHLWFDVDLSGLEKKEEYDLVECCVYDEGEEPWIFCVFDPSSGIQ
jgi:hypothetical protein